MGENTDSELPDRYRAAAPAGIPTEQLRLECIRIAETEPRRGFAASSFADGAS